MAAGQNSCRCICCLDTRLMRGGKRAPLRLAGCRTLSASMLRVLSPCFTLMKMPGAKCQYLPYGCATWFAHRVRHQIWRHVSLSATYMVGESIIPLVTVCILSNIIRSTRRCDVKRMPKKTKHINSCTFVADNVSCHDNKHIFLPWPFLPRFMTDCYDRYHSASSFVLLLIDSEVSIIVDSLHILLEA